MKHFKQSVALALLALAGGAATASTVNQTDRYFCSFSNADEFKAWTAVDLNGKSDEDTRNYWDYDSDRQAAGMKVSQNLDGDDWLFSPKVTLSGGKSYVVKIRFQASYPCQFKLTYGKDNTIDAQTNLTEVTNYDGWQYIKVELPAGVAGGNYHFGIHNVTSKNSHGWLFIHSFEVVDDRDGSIAFTLRNASTDKTLSGVAMTLSGDYYVSRTETTDDQGVARFEMLTPGNYTMNYVIDGYMHADPITVKVANNANVTRNVYAKPQPLVNITGKVVDYKGEPLSGANVRIKGSKTYDCETGSDGSFTFQSARGQENYVVTVDKVLYHKLTDKISVTNTAFNIGQLTLEPYFGSPAFVASDKTEAGMFVSWLAPVYDREFAHDNGVYQATHMQTGDNIRYMRYGVKYDEPMIVDEIKWCVSDLRDGKLDVGVYLLDANGGISSDLAFEAKDVPSQTYDWSDSINWQSYQLPEPVVAPYGCLIYVGHEATQLPIRICNDYLNNGGPSYFSYNDLENGWSMSRFSNYFIRANGTMLSREVDVAAAQIAAVRTRSLLKSAAITIPEGSRLEGLSYNVWRIAGNADESSRDNWVSVASGLNQLFVIDRKFNSLADGFYTYAVEAVSYDGRKSKAVYSPLISHNMTTDIDIYVFANTAVDVADGAKVTITGPDKSVYTANVVSNIASFRDIPKGLYTVVVEKYGFETAAYDNVDYSSDRSYETTIDINLMPLAPYNLVAEQMDNSNDVTLKWNESDGIFDDFEQMDDFTVDPAGSVGWTYADVDGAPTFGVSQCEHTPYPNMFAPMAFMAFNPTATTPEITSFVQPYSGNKVLVSVGAQTGVRNDDYIFSPELEFDQPVTFRFQAASGYYAILGQEEFMVGYVAEGEAKPENVTWLTEKPISVNGAWHEFSYTLPLGARHAVIRCVSNQCMFFMLDDIFIGCEEPDVFAMTSFNVYVDEELIGSTKERSFTIKNMEEGKHLAKVQTVYTMYDMSNRFSDFSELKFRVVEGGAGLEVTEVESLYSYDAATRTLTSPFSMDVVDMHGRVIASGRTVCLDASLSGVLVVSLHTDNGTVNRKIVI